MKKLDELFSDKRTGKNNDPASDPQDTRSEYQRDFDRIIFSSAFRRLQNKTQVFPLPGSVFVHNRLTHSLEVSSIGRTLGSSVGDFIVKNYSEISDASKNFYKHNLYSVISSACLCHDIGNPAFGHSGEDAIASYFLKNKEELSKHLSEKELEDFLNFEGNANAIRILTQHQNGKAEGGMKLTYSTLVSIAKYPCESKGKDKSRGIHRKKFGFFQSEKSTFIDIAKNTSMKIDEEEPLVYKRHPFVWLVEAADDICYNIIDLEDAHRLSIIDTKTCQKYLKNLIDCLGEYSSENITKYQDKNDKISFLRAKSINSLINKTLAIYKENFEDIINGKWEEPLFDAVAKQCGAISKIREFSVENIYNHRSVVEIENAGYNVMYQLLSHFIPPILKSKEERTKSDEKAIKLIPNQFLYLEEQHTPYQKVLGVLDYVSGMTDNYATELYRKIRGIDIGMKI